MTLLHVRTHHLHQRAIGTASAHGGLDLAAALTRADLPEPEGLWFIDRVDTRVCARAGLGERTSADLLAGGISRAVRAVLDGGVGQDGVRWFPDRTAYLAQWVTDLSTGHAHGRWEYAQLGTGDFSPTLRERVEAEPRAVLAALRSLPDTEIERLVTLLTPPDAARIAHAVAIGTGPADRVDLARTVAELWRSGRLPRDPRRATVAVLLHASAVGELPDPGSAAAARDLVGLCSALRQCDPRRRTALLAAAGAADARTLAAFGHGDLAASLTSWPDDDRRAAVAVLAAGAAPGTASGTGPGPERTPFGGLFLLLPLLAELPLADATAGWPDALPPDRRDDAGRGTPAELTGALALGAVLGIGLDVLSDPWTRLALGLPPDISRHVVGWSNRVTTSGTDQFTDRFADLIERRNIADTGDLAEPSLLLDPPLAPHVARSMRLAAAVLTRELSHRLPGQARASLDHLRRNVLACGATVHADDAAIVVELDPPPLAVLLSLTGMNRRRFTLPATGERPWVLTQGS
ncbi:hypothetical protein [Flexivirga oryzae]|uniref:Uncharacterized protein n=1 Tax=Flexivirga oryzae TaxID=1794944 RepID=A0A839N295_9MICO|nr:hypothetical protein [Flexivirga oryzae]MBB2890224.1 hypothetical protein [Flexivirga oryzae]